jgi:transcriptional regulator with XRE-family HTH domain
MSLIADDRRIDEATLSEQWFSFVHKLIGQIQHVFRESGLTQKTIAKRLGKRPEVISRCLAGQQNMTIRTMHDLARAMDCRLDIVVTPLRGIRSSNRRVMLEPRPIPNEPPPGTESENSKTYQVKVAQYAE